MIKNYLRAGYPALLCQTCEPDRAINTMAKECEGIANPFTWDCERGLLASDGQRKGDNDPGVPIKFASSTEGAVVFLMNYHRFITSIEVIQSIINSLPKLKNLGSCLIIVSPTTELPVEIQKIFTILSFDLPTSSELSDILLYVAESAGVELPVEVEKIIASAQGLTASEAENAFALSLVERKSFCSDIIAEQKAQLVKKNSSLDFSNFKGGFSTLAGLENLKNFCKRIVTSPSSRGVMLLGVPGTGKSHFAKVLGNETGLPTLLLDMGRLFGSLVGQSEQQCREALAVVDAMSPCILFIDEIEKGLSGIASSGQTDGGTGSRVFGTFLTWLQDHTSKVFVIATCNDISKIPPEFLRAERWDCIFFVDLPSISEREAIQLLYAAEYKIDDLPSFSTEGWSGAEIKSMYRIASMLSSTLEEAKGFIKPLSETMKDRIEGLREWASSRCVPASAITAISAAPQQRKLKIN